MDMEGLPRVLVVGSDEAETKLLWTALSSHALLTCAKALPEFKRLLRGDNYHLVFCAWSFHLGSWKEVLKEVREYQPALPVVVLANGSGEHEWMNVLQEGVFDLLAQADQKQHILLGVLKNAIASRNSKEQTGRSAERPAQPPEKWPTA